MVRSVYAGALPAAESGRPPAVGAVFVVEGPENGRRIDFKGQFETPTNHGSVRVVGAVEDKLTLRADDGTEFLFDAEALVYVER